MRDARTRTRFFSLVELLVVIGIIAMLVSLLLPALNKAKATARSIDCQGRLKQMTLGMTGYTIDNNDWFPFMNVGSGALAWQPGVDCFEAMDGYVFGNDSPGKQAERFYHCPSDTTAVSIMSYGVNEHRNGYSGAQDGIVDKSTTTVSGVEFIGQPCRTSQVQDFAGTFLFACYRNMFAFNAYWGSNGLNMDAPHDAWGWPMGLLHNNATNWGYCDGHAGWMRWQDSVGKGDHFGPKGIWTKTAGD